MTYAEAPEYEKKKEKKRNSMAPSRNDQKLGVARTLRMNKE